MSSRLPVKVNPFRLVEQRKILQGAISLKTMRRLHELLVSDEGEVSVELAFATTDTGLPVIEGEVKASLDLACQRCLQSLHHDFCSKVQVVLVQDDVQAGKLQEGFDTWLVEDENLYLPDFIEDEMLLALPLSVMHEQCEPVRPLVEALPEDELTTEAKPQKNPFAVLQSLKDPE